MNKKLIYKDDIDVVQRLKEFDVTQEELSEVVFKSAVAKLNYVPTDAKTAAGGRMYFDGTRALREIYIGKTGWTQSDEANIALIENKDKKLKIIFQIVENACDSYRQPRLLHAKKSISNKLVFDGQFELFDSEKKEFIPKNYEMWYFCVSVQDQSEFIEISAELSRPMPLLNGHFNDFYERIFIMQKDRTTISKYLEIEKDFSRDINIHVTRKRKTI